VGGVSIGARSVVLATGVVAVLAVPLLISVTASAADDVLLSQGRTALASSVENGSPPARATVDGDLDSRWASAGGPGSQWLRVDLGGPQSVERVKLFWAKKAYATAYRIQLSGDGASWTDLYATGSGDGGTDDLERLSGIGRYLRVLATQRGASAGYALREVRAYGPGPAGPAPTGSAPETPGPTGLDDPTQKEHAMELVSSAEHGTLNWRSQFGRLEDLGDGRGYTGGIAGFCSGTSDMLALITEYSRREPGNPLSRYLPALRIVDGSDSHAGLDPGFPAAWVAAAADPVFRQAQQDERDRLYFDPAVALARADGLRALGQFAYYDAAIAHGLDGLRGLRSATLAVTAAPRQGGDETVWLAAFLDARVRQLRTAAPDRDTSRVDTAQRVFLDTGNLDLYLPLNWRVSGDRYSIFPG
jgi:chitosanase